MVKIDAGASKSPEVASTTPPTSGAPKKSQYQVKTETLTAQNRQLLAFMKYPG